MKILCGIKRACVLKTDRDTSKTQSKNTEEMLSLTSTPNGGSPPQEQPASVPFCPLLSSPVLALPASRGEPASQPLILSPDPVTGGAPRLSTGICAQPLLTPGSE